MNSKKWIRKYGVLAALIGAAIVLYTWREGIAALRPSLKLYDGNINIKETEVWCEIQADVYAVLDSFAEECTEGMFGRKNESVFYIIPAYIQQENYYIGIKIKKNDAEIFDDLAQQTGAYLLGEEKSFGEVILTRYGCIKEMDAATSDLYYRWFRERNWFEHKGEEEKYALPLYIDAAIDLRIYCGFMMLGAGFLLLSIVLLIISAYSKKSEKRC